ncbi:MAG: ATP synthase F1 subunit delta [Anaeroplasma sp.]
MVESEYAKALHEIAIEENKIDLFLDCFLAVNEGYNNKDFMEIITSPFIEKNKKKEIINNVFKSLDQSFINFLYVIIDHNRFSIIKLIYEEYNKLVLEDKNIIKIQIISAKKLTEAQLLQFKSTLMLKYLGKKIEIENIVNVELIGGIQVLSNGESLDMSLKNSLDKLKESL